MKEFKVEIVDTAKQVGDLVDWLVLRHASPELYQPTMYLDLEGVNLCREGSVSILTILIDTGVPVGRICLVDVHSLNAQAFNTAGLKSKNLKDILQDKKIPKVFFDVRNDSDALFAHFGVRLEGVEDVQLMESASRATTGSRKYLNGLSKCVETKLRYEPSFSKWKLEKEKGQRLFKIEDGGSYEVFNKRPMPEDIIAYCAGDVQYLPKLWEAYHGGTKRWQDLVRDETKKRVVASQEPEYLPHGPGRTLAPWSDDQHRTLDNWNYVPSADELLDDLEGWNHEPEDWQDGYDDWDDGPTSCRDIISSADYDYYYSD